MRASGRVAALVLALAVAAIAASRVADAQAVSWRVMPLGDSITYGCGSQCSTNSCDSCDGGYRSDLFRNLTVAGYGVHFVGSQTSGPPTIDRSHEGHPGWRIDQINALLPQVLPQYTPDVLLIHLGTNDVYQNRTAEQCLDEMNALIATAYTLSPGIIVMQSTIIDMPLFNHRYQPTVDAFNDLLRGELNACNAYNGCNFVDVAADAALQFPGDYAPDQEHPNDSGYSKMAAAWFANIQNGQPPAP